MRAGQMMGPGLRAGVHLPDRRRSTFEIALPWVSGAIALLSFVVLHLKGIALNSDGWAYWQGAGSLLAGHGYTYFTDRPIVAWPPLYSIYLALWSSALGLTGWALIVANGTLVVLQTWLWCRVVLLIWSEDAGPPSPLASISVAIFVGGFVALNNQYALAGTLQYLFLPLLVLATWKIAHAGGAADATRWILVAIAVGSAAMLAHNSSIAFLLASAVLIVRNDVRDIPKLAAAAAIVGISLTVWGVVRYRMGLADSHAFGLGAGSSGPLETLHDLVQGVGTLIVAQRFGDTCSLVLAVVAVVVLTSRRPGTGGVGFRRIVQPGCGGRALCLVQSYFDPQQLEGPVRVVCPSADCSLSSPLRAQLRIPCTRGAGRPGATTDDPEVDLRRHCKQCPRIEYLGLPRRVHNAGDPDVSAVPGRATPEIGRRNPDCPAHWI